MNPLNQPATRSWLRSYELDQLDPEVVQGLAMMSAMMGTVIILLAFFVALQKTQKTHSKSCANWVTEIWSLIYSTYVHTCNVYVYTSCCHVVYTSIYIYI